MVESEVLAALHRIESRLEGFESKLQELGRGRGKALEWVGRLSEHIASLDAFREEVRASFEPISHQLDRLEEVSRILRHATSDVSRRVESLESVRRVG